MKEQNEAHSFEETPKWVTDYNANRQAVNVLEAELTRLRSELQQQESEWKDGLNQLGFHIEFDEESKHWFAQRAHDKVKIIVSSEKKETLANEIILSYQALLMHNVKQRELVTSELQQEREQLIECLEAIHRWYITDDGYWGTETHKFAESLIKKSKAK